MQAGNKLRSDQSDEESWVKLPDGSILSYDIFASINSINSGVGSAHWYVPSTNTWVDSKHGPRPAQLPRLRGRYELGPGFLYSRMVASFTLRRYRQHGLLHGIDQ